MASIVVRPPLLRPAPSSLPSIAPRSITLVRPSNILTCTYHFSSRRSTVARRSSYCRIIMLYEGLPRMLISDSVFAGDANDLSEASQL